MGRKKKYTKTKDSGRNKEEVALMGWSHIANSQLTYIILDTI